VETEARGSEGAGKFSGRAMNRQRLFAEHESPMPNDR
jgi:hypothetical protein